MTKSAVPADLVTFTEEILNGKLNFLCSDLCLIHLHFSNVLADTTVILKGKISNKNLHNDLYRKFYNKSPHSELFWSIFSPNVGKTDQNNSE